MFHEIKKNRAQAFVAAALIALPGAAVALPGAAIAQQGGVADESGIKIGSGRLNPVLTLETSYDSAAGVVPGAVEPVGDILFHVRPGIRFLAPSDSLQLKLNANYDYQAYMGSEAEELKDYSKSAADVDFGLLFNRDGDVQFELTNRFVRSDRHDAYSVGINSIANRNDAALRLIARSGDNWSIAPSYTLSVETFESVIDNGALESLLERYDNLTHSGAVEARYALAARTALLIDLGLGYRSYTGDTKVLESVGDSAADDVGNTRIQVGVTSMVASKVGVTLKAGYGSQFGLDDAKDGSSRGFSSAIGSAELAWYATELTSVRLGYGRSFHADPNHDYYTDDRVYLESALAFTRQLGVLAGVSYDMVAFGQPSGEDDDTVRKDSILSFHVGPEYQFNRWFSAGVRYGITNRTAETGGTEDESPYVNYDRHELGARVTFIY